jgi:hypothetical protein
MSDVPAWMTNPTTRPKPIGELMEELLALRATHARQADTIRRLTREHAEVVARLEVMREAVVGVRAERDALAAEVADLKISVIAFGATAMHQWAQYHGLPRGHLHPEHYDILARAGARMDDFTRAEVGE